MAVKTENTMAEGLQKMIQQIGALKLTPDADMPFLLSLETEIVQYLQGKMNRGGQVMSPNMNPGGGGMGAPGMPGAPLPSGPMGGRALANAPAPPAMSPGPPPVDEISRMLSGI